MQKFISWIVCLAMPFQSFAGTSAPGARNPIPFDVGVTFYNSVTSSELIEILNTQASASDKKYLSSLQAHLDDEDKKHPSAKIIGNTIQFVGLEQGITVVDAKHGIFSYNGTKFSVDPRASIESNIEQIQSALKGKSSALMNVIIPQVHAAAPLLPIALGVYAIGGIAVFTGCGLFSGGVSGSGFRFDSSCVGLAAAWPFVAAAAIILWGTSSIAKADELPVHIECAKTDGPKQMLEITRGNGKKVEVTINNGTVTTIPALTKDSKTAIRGAGDLLKLGCASTDTKKMAAINAGLNGITKKAKTSLDLGGANSTTPGIR